MPYLSIPVNRFPDKEFKTVWGKVLQVARKEHRVVRVKTSITMDKEFSQWIAKKIEESVFASKSHAIQYAIKQLMDAEKANRKSS